MSRQLLRFALPLLAASLSVPLPAAAQGWFVPKAQEATPAAGAAPHVAHSHSAPHAMVAPVAPLTDAAPAADEPPAPQLPLPPVPDLPALPKTSPPPAAVIGVLGVPDVMRNSDAAKAVEKIIGGRRDRLNADAQKEISAERQMGETLAAERGKLSADQQRSKEQQLRDRSMEAQKQFRQRSQVIQQAAQYALSQIERTLIAVIRQVSESHGMNLVLHRAQVALNINEFDITTPVTQQLNKVLPSVQVPPEGMTVQQFLAQQPQAPKAAH